MTAKERQLVVAGPYVCCPIVVCVVLDVFVIRQVNANILQARVLIAYQMKGSG